MTEVSFTASCNAPLDVTFEYLDDPRNVTDYWHGMVSYRPVGEPVHGVGATFEAVSKLGPSSLKSTIRTTEWERNVRVAYKSIAGVDTLTSFDFAAVDDSHCTVEFRIEFQLPGGIAGRMLEKTLEPVIATAARNTAENISHGAAAHWAARLAAEGRGADSLT